jgi:hypothetical protein
MVARFAKEGKHTSSIIRPFIYEGKANTPLQYYIQTLISKPPPPSPATSCHGCNILKDETIFIHNKAFHPFKSFSRRW